MNHICTEFLVDVSRSRIEASILTANGKQSTALRAISPSVSMFGVVCSSVYVYMQSEPLGDFFSEISVSTEMAELLRLRVYVHWLK